MFPVGLYCSSFGVGVVADDLGGVLSEVGDLGLEGLSFFWVLYFGDVDAVLIGEWVEDIHVFDCIFASLLVSVDEVDPMVDVLRHVS